MKTSSTQEHILCDSTYINNKSQAKLICGGKWLRPWLPLGAVGGRECCDCGVLAMSGSQLGVGFMGVCSL